MGVKDWVRDWIEDGWMLIFGSEVGVEWTRCGSTCDAVELRRDLDRPRLDGMGWTEEDAAGPNKNAFYVSQPVTRETSVTKIG